MRTIPLTQGKFAIIDDVDYESVNRFKWYLNSPGYARTGVSLGYINGKEKKSKMVLHRLIMRPPKGMQVDHINHNTLDCRRANMRICTNQENARNQAKYKGTSIFKGVYFNKRDVKWRAQIGYNGNQIHLGNFDNEEDGARAYDTAAKKLFGEFANCNFPL